MKRILMMLEVVATSLLGFAGAPKPEGGPYKETVDGIEWTFMVDADLMASVGDGTYQGPAVAETTSGSITVPMVLGVRVVTSIGDYAFAGCSGLTSVTIPSSVTSIGYYAFSGCDGLTSVSIPSSVTSIGDGPFSGCRGLVAISVDPANPNYKSVNGLLLTKDGLTLVAGVKGDVTIPSSVTSIGWSAFSGCSGLTSVAIPDSVTWIGEYAFAGCFGLTSVAIPDSVTWIDNGAFGGCSGLTSVTIPSSVMSIGDYDVFNCCSGLVAISVDPANPNYKSVNGLLLTKDGLTLVAGVKGDVTIPSSVTSIGDGAFSGRDGLTSVTIPSSVTSIGDSAFFGCSGLTSVTIPSSVTSIGYYAFSGCDGLTSVSIPSSVTSIGLAAFFMCKGLTSVTIPSSVTDIGVGAFQFCDGLTAVDFEGAPPEGLAGACVKQDAAIRYNIACEDEWLPVIKECGFTNASAYVPPLPDGGPYKETVAGIEWTFMVNKGLAASVGDGDGGNAVTNTIAGAVVIPSTLGGRPVAAIDDKALFNCKDVTSVAIPECVKDVGSNAFGGCSGLKDIYIGSKTLTSLDADAFKNCNWDLIMHVPADWQGRGRTLCGYSVWRAGSSDEEKSVNLATTNVVVQYVLNSVQPEIAVPVSGDTGFVAVITEVTSSGAVSVPIEWRDNYPAFKTMYGNDFGKSLMMKSGKKDGAGNEMFVWQDYVAGTDPTDIDDKFTASITMVGDVPVISYSPELTAEQAALRTYKTFGKKQLKDEWSDLTGATSETLKDYNFFKVTVQMK